MTRTLGDVAELTGILIPPHLVAQAEPPIIPAGAGGRQGDVYILSYDEIKMPTGEVFNLAECGSYEVIRGTADTNPHVLSGDGMFHVGKSVNDLQDYGVLVVPDGGMAYITHPEHATTAIPCGTWRVFSQVSYEDELRRSAD